MGYTIGTISARQVSSGNPITLSVEILPGETVLVVPLVATGATDRAGGAPTYGSQTLLQADTTQKAAASPETSTELWYLLNPPVGTQTLTIPNTGAISIRYHVVRAMAGGRYSSFLMAVGANGTSTNPGATLTGIPEGNAFLCAVIGSGAQTWAPSARNGWQISDTDAGNTGDGFQYAMRPHRGTQLMGWSFTTTEDWGIVAAAFGEVSALKLNNYQFVDVGDGMSMAEKSR